MKVKMKRIEVVIGDNPEMNRRVQEHANKIGYSWELRFNKPVFTNSHQLYFNHDGFIYRGLSTERVRDDFWSIDPETFLRLSRQDVDYLYRLEN